MDDQIETIAAPELPKAVQLNEDAQLRVLAGTSSYVTEAKKKAEEKKEEKVDEEMKVGDEKKTAKGGTVTKTKSGIVHKAGPGVYGGSDDKDTDPDADDEPKSKKKAKKESVEPEFKSKFMKMVEAKKEEADKKKADKKKKMEEGAKPDFLDLDKDGNKKEPMKKAASDKGDDKKDGKKGMSAAQAKYFGKKNESVEEGKDEGKPGKNFAKIAKKAGEKYGSKEAGERVAGAVRKKVLAKESKMVAESVEPKLSFKDMVKLVQESGGQQQIDPKDKELFNWASRVATNKLGEGMKAELYAGLIYERNGGVFEMYDVLAEDQK